MRGELVKANTISAGNRDWTLGNKSSQHIYTVSTYSNRTLSVLGRSHSTNGQHSGLKIVSIMGVVWSGEATLVYSLGRGVEGWTDVKKGLAIATSLNAASTGCSTKFAV